MDQVGNHSTVAYDSMNTLPAVLNYRGLTQKLLKIVVE